LGGLRHRLHERLQAEPSQTTDFATALGVELPLEHLAASGNRREEAAAGQMLMMYIRIEVQVDLQVDKSSVVVKGPFS
jgi:hypothetical protein